MRLIARGTLLAFVRNRVEHKLQDAVFDHLDQWYRSVLRASWRNSAELKAQYRSASIISAERVVFNIKGNDFRLVAWINYTYGAVRILWLGTHREYDRIDVRTIAFERSRYGDSSDPE